MAKQLISDYLNKTSGDAIVWGQNDCALWPASLVHEATGVDPAAHLRGIYSTWVGCRNLLMQRGGLEAVASDCMKEFSEGEDRNGVAVARVGKRVLCGILLDGVLCVKAPVGYTATSEFELIRGWKW